ncbi:hypothetical protein EBU24_01465 [bacterium]|nr:hypothetical protein [bacterium]
MKIKLFFSITMFFILTSIKPNESLERDEFISLSFDSSEEQTNVNYCTRFHNNIIDNDTKTHRCCCAINCALCVSTATICGLNILCGGPLIHTAFLSLGIGCESIALWSLMASSKASFSEVKKTIIASQPTAQIVLFR